jgi:NAD(P)-dependent dehydrogenase (short-subunit alcohol dehydrogenase family)
MRLPTDAAAVLILAWCSTLADALNVGTALTRLESIGFSAVREQEGLLRRLKNQVALGDSLARLQPEDYVLPAGSAVVVTGANDGIGRSSAVFLAQHGYVPIVCARSDAKAIDTAAYIRDQVGADAPVGCVALDLANFSSVEEGITKILDAATELDAPLRGLLLNAGVWPTERRLTVDGLEEGLQVCHVSHWMLAEALVPKMCDGGGEARVVSVASSAHALTDSIKLDDLSWESRRWDSSVAYGESKLANIYFAQALTQRQPMTAEQRLTSLSVHPGVVATSLFRDFSPGGLPLPPSAQLDATVSSVANALFDAPPVKLLLKKPEDGCRTSMYALLAPGLPTGSYLSDCELTDVSPAAKNTKARDSLWEWTETWVAEKRATMAERAAESGGDAIAP